MARSLLKTALWISLASAIPVAKASTCYSNYRGYYECDGGLGYGARIGIAVGIAVGVLLLLAACMYWRRRNLRNRWSKFRPPALPTQNEYASNPPPPANTGASGQYQGGGYGYNDGQNQNASSWNNNPYGSQPPAPANTYQPSMSGQYGGYQREVTENGAGMGKENATGQNGYKPSAEAPPGYDVTSNTASSTSYAPPPGAPPK